MKKTFYSIYMKLSKFIPSKLFVFLNYTIRHKRIPNMRNPQRYTEKLQLKMIGNQMIKYTDFVDKYKVRGYIEEKIGEKYLINLVGVYDNVEEIDFNSLPNQFVLKTNHGSGYFIICKEKQLLNIDECKIKLTKWMKENFYNKCKEKQYKNINRKIICEELICDLNDNFLDCRVYCFNGRPEFIQIDEGFSDGNTKRNHYDLEWNLLKMKMKYDFIERNIEKPQKLNEIITLSEKLSQEFDFVRVDFYLSDEKIYFSELTFSPAGGRQKLEPDKYDFILGEKLVLD
ncbi:glycosyl transferase [Terrisporobacter petrolearius]|uniref:ATP-grasp fold amidoligase family protein n=1 Tax=Terrisporobacter petrolearius TaxID=1460447 RepID=UPI001D169293|nr:ATP-grasp fold amidoligase family protein [Terrisporobacter petrolearius]MCC3862734.1 glycosyl transferase [Terrisporobacter petrolearius]